MTTFRLLTPEEIKNKSVDCIALHGEQCEMTDYAVVLGGYSVPSIPPACIQNRESTYWLGGDSALDNGGDLIRTIIPQVSAPMQERSDSRRPGIRPVVKFSEIASKAKTYKQGIETIAEYGHYPQTVMSKEYSQILENRYYNNQLKQTNNTYTIDTYSTSDIRYSFLPKSVFEYEYNGERYVRIERKPNNYIAHLSDGRKVEDYEVYWFKVEPVKWYVDEKNDLAVAQKALVAGIPYKDPDVKINSYTQSTIHQYLNSTFIKEIENGLSKNEIAKKIFEASKYNFSSEIKRRGRDYYSRNKVIEVNKSYDEFNAKVSGSNGEVYDVNIEYKNGVPKYRCSCPCTYSCKHIYATILELIEEDKNNTQQNGYTYNPNNTYSTTQVQINNQPTASSASTQQTTSEQEKELEKEIPKRDNPYNLNSEEVDEEDILKAAIDADLAVLLHGKSSDGKSARVKAIDPDCRVIYLRNATPESLNGKSVYDSNTGKMKDIKPTWLEELEEKCKDGKIHIVFFDEITNALPSIQGMAFNIVLDKEVNGKWKLPENARIVAAGNEYSESLAANKMAEPLYNRFVHIFIETTTEKWLKWASEHNIHPAIYSYIASTQGKNLRTPFTGEKPNADPRKWEMASKLLYKTNNPHMLRGLLGKEVTDEFIKFCQKPIITIKDVLEGNYTEYELRRMNLSEKNATAYGLSQVSEEYLDEIRFFVTKLGSETTELFDTLWLHRDPSRLERLQEAILENRQRIFTKTK